MEETDGKRTRGEWQKGSRKSTITKELTEEKGVDEETMKKEVMKLKIE